MGIFKTHVILKVQLFKVQIKSKTLKASTTYHQKICSSSDRKHISEVSEA